MGNCSLSFWRSGSAARGVAAVRCCHRCEWGNERVSSLAVGIIYGILCVRAAELVAGHAASGGASSNPEPWVAKVMGWPGGTMAIEVAGAGLVAARGTGGMGPLSPLREESGLGARVSCLANGDQDSGRVRGIGPRFAGGSVRGLSHSSGVTSDPAQAKSVDQTLRALVYHPFGAVAIGAIALGLLAFGVFSFFDARLRRL